MQIVLPDIVVQGVELTPARAALHLAVGLFASREVTLGQGAVIAGLPHAEFLCELGRRGVPVHYDLDDLEADVKTISDLTMDTAR